jgi:ABC-type branched-subunit amino acid transport system ATPase component
MMLWTTGEARNIAIATMSSWFEIIRTINRQGVTIFHGRAKRQHRVRDRLPRLVLQTGQVGLSDPAAELRKNELIIPGESLKLTLKLG